MAYRLLKNTDEHIIRAVQEIGATIGVQSITAAKIAKKCDISNFTVVSCFGNMRKALDAAAQSFDRHYMAKVEEMAAEGADLDRIWDEILNYFLDDPNGTIYYNSYTQYFGFDPTENNERSAEFLATAKAFLKPKAELSDHKYLILWDYMTSMMFYYAEKFIRGYIQCDESNRAIVKDIVFGGVNRLLGN